MPEDETVEVPLPEGTLPDPDGVITQEIKVGKPAFPEVQLVSPVKVDLPPVHLLGDPIMTMEAPVADNTCLYDQLNPPAPKPLPRRPRRRMKTGDRFLLVLTVATVGMGVTAYGMAVYGWGAGDMPKDEAKPHTSVVSTDEPTVLPTTGVPTYRPPVKAPVKAVSDPTTYSPTPEASVVVVSPTPSETVSAPETPVETTTAPEPSPTHTRPSTPPPSPTPGTPSPTPTPSQSSASPTFSITLPASPTEEQSSE